MVSLRPFCVVHSSLPLDSASDGTSGLYRRCAVVFREGGGVEADPNIPGVKTLKDPIHDNVWKACKTKIGVYFDQFNSSYMHRSTTLSSTIFLLDLFHVLVLHFVL